MKQSAPVDLLSESLVPHWTGGPQVQVKPHLMKLGDGSPMTTARFTGWEALGLPLNNYVIDMEARRVAGHDFFAALTFPVGALNRCITFINGGWGGNATGLSNVDNETAAENRTGSSQVYLPNHWHHFRLSVSDAEITVEMDDRLIVRLNPHGRDLAVRPGDIEDCQPFGLASYLTSGEIRRLEIQPFNP